VVAKLGAYLMHRRATRPRELELTARLERHRRVATGQRDDGTAVELAFRLPTEPACELLENAKHASLAGIGQRRPRGLDPAELLHLGSDGPLLAGFASLHERREQILPVAYRLVVEWLSRRQGRRVGRGYATSSDAGDGVAVFANSAVRPERRA
jgi:hypothetical protein